MTKLFQKIIEEKRLYYALVVAISLLAMMILTADVFTQSRDGRSQIVDEDGGEEFPVSGSLKSQEELRLSSMLSEIRGVGASRVMITWQEREEAVSVFQSEPEIRRIQGVIVAAEGAVNASVQLSIIDAVTAVYGIPTSSVKVFPLKQ